MKKSVKNKAVTPRDRQLFDYLYKNRVAMIDDINRDVFENKDFSVVCRRLSKLYHGDWLDHSCVFEVRQKKTVYHVSNKSFERYIKSDVYDYTETRLKSDAVFHDLALLKIRNAFLKLNDVTQYLTENEIRQEASIDRGSFNLNAQVHSDAIIKLKSSSGGTYDLPIEFESVVKSRSRCGDKVVQYYTSTNYRIVLYVYIEDSIKKQLSLAEASLVQDNKYRLYFAKLEDVLKYQGFITFTNQKGGQIELR